MVNQTCSYQAEFLKRTTFVLIGLTHFNRFWSCTENPTLMSCLYNLCNVNFMWWHIFCLLLRVLGYLRHSNQKLILDMLHPAKNEERWCWLAVVWWYYSTALYYKHRKQCIPVNTRWFRSNWRAWVMSNVHKKIHGNSNVRGSTNQSSRWIMTCLHVLTLKGSLPISTQRTVRTRSYTRTIIISSHFLVPSNSVQEIQNSH